MPAPSWFVEQGVTYRKTPAQLHYLWDYSQSRGLGSAGARLMLAILPQEGTGSYNTSPDNRGADGGHGPEPDWQLDVRRAVNLVAGKLKAYTQAVQQGFRDLAVRVVSPGSGEGTRATGSPIEWINWRTAIVEPDGRVRLGAYAVHGSWWVGVSRYYAQMGGTLEELEAVARELDALAPRLDLNMDVVTGNAGLASNWNGTKPEPAVIVTSYAVIGPALGVPAPAPEPVPQPMPVPQPEPQPAPAPEPEPAPAGLSNVPCLLNGEYIGEGRTEEGRYILETPLLILLLELGGQYDGRRVSLGEAQVEIRRPAYRFEKPLALLLDALGLQRGIDYDWQPDPPALLVRKGGKA